MLIRSLETTPEENLRMAYETIACLHDNGLEVFVDFEHAMDAACGRRENGDPCDPDFSKRSLDYFNQMTAQCVRQNVSRLVICDTTGGAGPEEVTQVISGLTWAYPNVRFGFHGHTDRGLGVANTRAAIFAGAVQIQGTLLGTGERCGNVNLTTVIGSMQLRGEAEFVTPESLSGPTSLAHTAYAAFGLEVPHGARDCWPGRVWHLGRHAWQQRAQKSRGLPVVRSRQSRRQPCDRGQRQSGKANIILLSESLGVALDAAQAQTLIDANQAMIDGGGFTASEVSFRLACMRVLKTLRNSFSVKSWRVVDESDEAGNRFVQASMSLSDWRLQSDGKPSRGRRSGGCAEQGHAAGTGKLVSGDQTDAAGHVQRYRASTSPRTIRRPMCALRSASTLTVTNRGLLRE